MTYPGYPPGRSPPASKGRAAAPWITLRRKAPLILPEILSKQTGPALLAGPLSAASIVGFWVAHYFFLDWRNKSASLQSMSDSELSDVLDWWAGGGPFGRNTPDLVRVRSKGTEDELRAALKRVIGIYDEKIKRTKNVSLSTSEYEYKRMQLVDELSRLLKR